jgi:ABC-type glycerol-3-phosphate transport system substrate-binding protein
MEAALFPGGKAGLVTGAFGVSAGTAQPELAYALAQYLTTRPDLHLMVFPARKSVVQRDTSGWRANISAELHAIIEQGLENGIGLSTIRFSSYLNKLPVEMPIKDGLLAIQTQAMNDLKAADAKKGTLRVSVIEPVVETLPPGKIALKFDVASLTNPLPNKDQWNRVIQEFTASDPQVGLVNLRVAYDPVEQSASRSDCFYLPYNAVPTIVGNPVINLDPLLSADSTFDRSDIPPGLFAAVQRGNKTYALPVGIEPLILRYKSEYFAAASIPAPSNDWKIESFVNTLKTLRPDSASPIPFADNGTNGSYLLVLIAAYGGVPIDYRVTPLAVNFSDPATVTAIQQALDLAKRGYVRYTALGILRNGTPIIPDATTSIYPNTLNGFSGTDPNKPVLFPGGSRYTGLAYNMGTAYISAMTPYPEACYRLIKALAQRPELFSVMPVRHSTLISSTLKASTSPDVMALYTQVDALLRDPNTIPFPVIDKGNFTITDFLVQNWMYEAFDSYVLDDGDLEAALKEGENYARNFLACTANINGSGTANSGADTTRAYIECGEKVDARLKPFLDQLAR